MSAKKTAEVTNREENRYKVQINVPGEDGSSLHDEVILMVDGSYSGNAYWPDMKTTIIEIAKTVLNGKGNTQLSVMTFGMGDNPVVIHVKSVEELTTFLGTIPGSLLYGRSSTNCEAGFTGVAEYIDSHDETLNEAYVIFISDGDINTDETPYNFYNWKENAWLKWKPEVIASSGLKDYECQAVSYGDAVPSNAYRTVFGDKDVQTVYSTATNEEMMAWADQVWADVYAFSGLTPGEAYPVSTVERAFVYYDKTNGTRVQDIFYYALVGRTYPERWTRTPAAGNALAANAKVNSLYVVDTTAVSNWMMLSAENAEFVHSEGIAGLLSALDGVIGKLSATPYNDVVVTDYMSKWVNMDPDTVQIVDNVTGNAIWTKKDGWLITENIPTAQNPPVQVELVSAENYEAGGADVVGNTSGDIYKLTWYVKDGALLRSHSYHVEYEVVVDTAEEGFVYNTEYPANGTTQAAYTDENGEPGKEEIAVPTVYADISTAPCYTVTVNYFDKATGEQIAASYHSDDMVVGSAYDVYAKNAIAIEGYTYDSTSGDALAGTMDNHKVVNVYYVKDVVVIPEESTPDTNTPDTNTPDTNTPDTNTPDTNIPETSTSTANPPTVEIQQEPVPATSAPADTTSLFVIEDEDVPLSSVPKTGDEFPVGLWILAAAGSGLGLMAVVFGTRKRKIKE